MMRSLLPVLVLVFSWMTQGALAQTAPAPDAAAPAPSTAAPSPSQPPATASGPSPAPMPTPVPPPTAADDVPPPPPPPPTYPNATIAAPSEPAAPYLDETASAPIAKPPEPLGVFGIGLSLGLAFGGDELVAATYSDGDDASLRAGQGVVMGIHLALVPLRSGAHSLGIMVEQELKLSSLSARNASISLVRFPLLAELRYGYAVDDEWSFIGGAGVDYEHNIAIVSDGDADSFDVDYDNALGFVVDAGGQYRDGGIVAAVVLRYTQIKYSVGPFSDIDAMSIALVASGSYYF